MKSLRVLSTIRYALQTIVACCIAATLSVPNSGYAISPSNMQLLLVCLRGGADIGFQMIQPDLDSSLSLPLNRLRPTIYDTTINNRKLTGTGYGYHPYFAALNTIHGMGDLAIVPLVGIQNMPTSHREAELAYAYGNPNALTGPQIGYLQRFAHVYFPSSSYLLDFSGGHPTTAGGSFMPLSLYRAQQAVNVDGNYDGILFSRENLFRLTMFYQAMQKTPQNSNNELDTVQRRIAAIGTNDGIIRLADNSTPNGYQNDAAGLLFQNAEMLFRYGRTADRRAETTIAFGVIDDAWDSHVNQNQSNSPFQLALSRLNNALDRFRINTSADLWENTVIVIYTDMGRSIPENLQFGTDHGGANTVLVIGGRVVGGIHGSQPTISQIEDKSGALPVAVTWTDVLADIFIGMGYTSVVDHLWPGYNRQALGLLN